MEVRPCLTKPLEGPVSKTPILPKSSGIKDRVSLIVSIKISGPFSSLGVNPSPHPTPSFWKLPIRNKFDGIPR